jgi:hypothetical protein
VLEIRDEIRIASRMFKKAVQRGRSERRGEAYSLPYVEPLSDVRTKLADFFNILLANSRGLIAGYVATVVIHRLARPLRYP